MESNCCFCFLECFVSCCWNNWGFEKPVIIMFANICLDQNPGRGDCYCSNMFLMATKLDFVFGLKPLPFRLYFCCWDVVLISCDRARENYFVWSCSVSLWVQGVPESVLVLALIQIWLLVDSNNKRNRTDFFCRNASQKQFGKFYLLTCLWLGEMVCL